jgi:hypothetical protein
MDTMKHTADTGGVTTAGNNHRGAEMIKKIGQATSAIPPATWLVLGGGAVVGAAVLKVVGRDASANFVGHWAPTLLMLGLYHKMVKMMECVQKGDRIG